MCVCHTARRRLWSVCVQLVGLEWEEGGEPGARHCMCWRAADHRMRSATPVCVCVRWTRLVVVRAPWRCASRRKFVVEGWG